MKFFSDTIFQALALLSLLSMASCSGKGGFPADSPGDPGVPVAFVPVLDWGASRESVMDAQDSGYGLEVSSDTLLRYSDGTGRVTVDYKFTDGKLVCPSMTQGKLSSLADAAALWLAGYDMQLESETTLVGTSGDGSTLAYGRLLYGGDCTYVSVAWTYVDPDGGCLADRSYIL